MPVISSKAPRRAAAVFAVSLGMLFTAACGSGEASTSSGATGTNGQSGGDNAFAAYISCLNQNGVTITVPSGGPGGGGPGGGARPSGAPDGNGARPSGQPRPSGGPGFPGGGGGMGKPEGVDDATWAKAQEACASVRPSMGAGGGNRGGGNRGGGNRGGGGANAAYDNCLKENGVTDTANLDTTDATVKKAVETCSVLKPTATATS